MDINEILSSLGLDLSNPEVKQGAMDAIDAILTSRQPPIDLGGVGGDMGGEELDVELDPDLIQPSIKHQPPNVDIDAEIEDEEEILKQIQHNDSEDTPENNSAGDTSEQQDSGEEPEDSSDSDSNNSNTSQSTDSNADKQSKQDDTNDDTDGKGNNEVKSDDTNDSGSAKEDSDEEGKPSSTSGDDEDEEEDGDEGDSNEASEEADYEDSEYDYSDDLEDESERAAEDDDDEDSENEKTYDEEDVDGEEQEDGDKDDYDPEDEDFLDDELNNTFDDEQIKAKHDSRKIKRERTLEAAKKALADAKARKAAPALIRELEKSIEALEALTEAVKSIKDISDEEFNQLINRVFDAIDAVGDKSLTFTSEEERAARAQEIKNDLASSKTQSELSAEDAAKIRAETQTVKAREKEVGKYFARDSKSFKGFQDFLNSLYRAIALQVQTDDVRDSTWSALSRRNSGAGVLQQGKKVMELNDRKIPVIDFYFDQSGSWTAKDIAIGKKAVSQLADLEEQGKIKVNIYYFSDDVFSDASSARALGGTGGWNEIVKNVIATQATNVVIMTDSDMESWWHGPEPLRYTVPGYVWYLWKRGINAPRLPRDLKGRGGTQQFAFDMGDA